MIRRLLVLLAGLTAPACGRAGPILAPRPAITCPDLHSGTVFRAGFGRSDITPPTGAGMLGYGPESNVSRGYRQRLQSRAMALEDRTGERIILAVADLDFIPGALHRAVAARVRHCAGLDADRIVLSATHTHSAPGHHAAHKAYDSFGTGREGYDPVLLHYLADRISTAMLQALEGMRPARAGWGQAPVWQVARIRSWDAHMADLHRLPSNWPVPPEIKKLPPLWHIDPTLTLFRVDTQQPTGGFAPAGAWALFAVHGTGIPAPNDLYDSDVHGVAALELERGIDALNQVTNPAVPKAIAMLANSAQGDALPDTEFDPVLCSQPLFVRELRPGSWRTAPGGETYIDRPGYHGRKCLDQGIDDTRATGLKLGQAAVRVFEAMKDSLSTDVRIARMFRTVPLRGPLAPLGLCDPAQAGTSQLAGAETRGTRYVGFKWFGLIPSGIEQGNRAIRWSPTCISPKRSPRLLQSALTGEHGFEEAAQFSIIRIGGMVLGTLPFEATTTAGARMKERIRTAMGPGSSPSRVILVGLANNYVSYVTTRLEYQRQHYEGGSTLYGPASAEVYEAQLELLTRELVQAGWNSPPLVVPPFPIFPGPAKRIVEFKEGPAPKFKPVIRCAGVDQGHAILRWRDHAPGWLIPERQKVVVVDSLEGTGWVQRARDGTIDLEVRWLRNRGDAHSEWEARWLYPQGSQGEYRFRLIPPKGEDPDEKSMTRIIRLTADRLERKCE